jgi:hypothetical protein
VNKDFLYNLLPSFIRYRDAFEGEPLRALMTVLESQALTLEQDLYGLYDNWFIETCDPWVVPYIGDLLGVHGLAEARHVVFSQRAQVANTLAYRRRKGTLGALARAAQDATGWYAQVVKGTDQLVLSASVHHPKAGRQGSLNLRDAAVLDPAATPFLPWARTADVRSPNNPVPGRPDGSGFGSPVGLGLHFWRLQAYPVARADARPIGRLGALDLFTFSPFGDDRPLFNLPRTLGGFSGPMTEQDVPGPLRRQPLAEEIAARREGRSPATDYFGEPVAFQVALGLPGRKPEIVDPKEIVIWDLTRRAPAPDLGSARLVVDPVSGRLALPAGARGKAPEVSYCYGFGADIGGGPYRRPGVAEPDADTWEAVISSRPGGLGSYRGQTGEDVLCYRGLAEALAAWPRDPQGRPKASVRFLDSATYEMPAAMEIALPQGKTQLTLEAADGAVPFLLAPKGLTFRADTHADILLSGLWIEGGITVGGSVHLEVHHSTVRPPRDAPASWAVRMEEAGKPHLALVSSITGPLRLARGADGLTAHDSIIDGGETPAIAAHERSTDETGAQAVLLRCTVFGPVAVESLQAGDTLFTAPVRVEKAWKSQAASSHFPTGSSLGEQEPACVPTFVSMRFGDPGYAQLGPRCPREIAAGGSEGAEIGVFHQLDQPFREARLPAVLNEYVPWGLEARVRFVT